MVKTKRLNLKMPPEYQNKWPIIGSAHLLLGKDTKFLLKLIHELGNHCIAQGGIMYGYVGPYLCYGITDPDDAVTVLNNCLEKNWVYNFTKRWAGDGLATVTSNLNVWKRHRKVISRAVNQQVLDGFICVYNKQSSRLIETFDAYVDKGPFDFVPVLEDLLIETMYQTTMGLDPDEMKKIFDKDHKEASRIMLSIIATRFQNILMYNDFLYSLTSLKKLEDENLEIVHRISNAVIDTKRQDLNNNSKKTVPFKSFVDLLLEMPPEDAFTHEEIREEVDTMVLAGSDTTATMLTYALMLLGSNQDKQEKLYEELKEVFNDTARDTSKQDLTKLVYTEAVLMETMRLFPILPAIMRYVAKDTQLKNYTLAAGSNVFVFAYSIHRDPSLWGPDAAEFRPERWVAPNSPSPAALRSYAAFSIGKRGCLGKAQGMLTMKMFLSRLMRQYRVFSDISKLELKNDLLLKPAAGCEISIERRS
ncbi:hypothetical protein O0L34_g8832 [Tuta absoluta]|nr:hypothetical protein O0L34_g8832 [Tuta absoluta]